MLRDGRKLIGVLRSYDQFGEMCRTMSDPCPLRLAPANLVLEDTIERIYHGAIYGDIHRGVFLIRGENVVLVGEVVRIEPSLMSGCPDSS